MGVKYIMQLRATDNVAWQCDIETATFSDTPIVIRGVSESAAILAYGGDKADDPFDPFIPSTLTLNFYDEGQVDMSELMSAGDKDFSAKLFREGLLYWAGYLKSEDVQRNFLSPPQKVTISFLCGLAMLADIPYTHQDLMGSTGDFTRCPLNYIRQILFANLDIKLPIRWTNALQCTAFTGDFFAGEVQWSPFNEGFYSYQQSATGGKPGPLQTCKYILEGFLRATQCRIYQAGGKWVIRRVNEVITGNVHYKEIGAGLGVFTVVSGTESLFQRIGRSGYKFIDENALITTKRGIKSFKTTYTANIRTNIIPNGSLDQVLTRFLFWGTYDDAGFAIVPVDSLDGQAGTAAELVTIPSVGNKYFTMVVPGGVLGKNGLPIDAFTLIKLINFSFMFSANAGFPTDPVTGIIDWSSNPLQIKVILNQGLITYYLNEFGTWSTVDTIIPISIAGLKIDDIAQVSFDKFQGVKVPQPALQPIAGDTCDIQIIFIVKENQQYVVDNISITINNANDVYEVFYDASKNTSTDNVSLNISSSFGGYMLSNFMTSPFNSGAESRFNDALLYSGTLTGINSHAQMRFRYKSSQIINTDMYVAYGRWVFDEIYTVDTLIGKNFLPLNAKYYIEKGIVNIIAIEGRNDNITLRESFYSSNDNQNSN